MAKAKAKAETKKTFGTIEDLRDWVHRRGGRGDSLVMADVQQYLDDAIAGKSYTLSRCRPLRAEDFEKWGIPMPGVPSTPEPAPEPVVEVPPAEA